MKTLLKLLLIITVATSLFYASEQSPTKDEVAKLYVATFNRAPDSAGLDYWIDNSGLTLSQIAQSFFDQEETQNLYPSYVTNRDFIYAVYRNLFNRDPDEAGLLYWEDELNSQRSSRDLFILTVINGAQDTSEYGYDKTILENKKDVGVAFANEGLSDVEKAREIISGITADPSSVESALAKIENISSSNISTVVSSIDTIEKPSAIVEYGDKLLFVGTQAGLIYSIDISDKNSPEILSVLITKDSVEDLIIVKDKLYVANNIEGLVVVDISIPYDLYIERTIFSGYAWALESDNTSSKIFVASSYDGVNVFDTATLQKTAHIDMEEGYTAGVRYNYNTLYVANLYSTKITAILPDNNYEKGAVFNKLEINDMLPVDMDFVDIDILISNEYNGLLIYSLQTKSLISQILPKYATNFLRSTTVSPDKTQIYLSMVNSGIEIYDISNIYSPKLIQTVDYSIDSTPPSPFESVVSEDGQYLYVIDSVYGLKIIKLAGVEDESSSDTTTIDGTTWVNKEPDGYFSYSEAKEYCEDLGYRLPTPQELTDVWYYYDEQISPPGFEKDTFYWAQDSTGCAMDYDCSNASEPIPEDGYGHPKCVVP